MAFLPGSVTTVDESEVGGIPDICRTGRKRSKLTQPVWKRASQV
jgi:hypothetical protein